MLKQLLTNLKNLFRAETHIDHLYEPATNSKAARQLVKLRNEIYLDSETPAIHAITIAREIDQILKYMDNVDMELPRYGL